MHRQLENGKGAVELFDGLLYLRWNSGAFLVESDAHLAMNRASALCQNRPWPLLMVMNRMEGVEHRARKVFAQAWPFTRIAVVGVSPVDRVLVDFYVARHSPSCPTKFFTSTFDAMTWLGVRTAAAEQEPRILAGNGPALRVAGQETPGNACEPDALLNVLLERLDVALLDIGADARGTPLFAVEGKLTQRLREALPGVQFTAQDIRTWSAEISS